MEPQEPRTSQSWLILALTSGAFAAFNGAFAKLTTTSLTSSLTSSLSLMLSLPEDPGHPGHRSLDLIVRILFFVLNLASNGIMWTLFTRALTAHSSATQVSILNTSANFLVTALLGWGVFGEKLGGLWFVGAGCLVLGNVVIGRGGGGEENGQDQGQGQGEGERKGEGQRERDGLETEQQKARKEVLMVEQPQHGNGVLVAGDIDSRATRRRKK